MCARSPRASTRRSASARRPRRAWCGSPSRSGAGTACARSAARAGSPTRRSSRCTSSGWSTSRSSAAPRRSRRRRSRRSRTCSGRSSCPSASGSSASRTSARSRSASTRTATASTGTCRRAPARSWRSSMPAFDLGLGRHVGLTHVIDKGLGPRAWEDILEVAGEHISIVKLGWGTAYVTGNLERKLEVLRDKPVVIGGTFFEVCYVKDRLHDYKEWLQQLGLTHVEISDGTIEIPRERKLELISDFARDFTVLSEVGSSLR